MIKMTDHEKYHQAEPIADAFDTRSAEHEQAWLARVFVEPSRFARFTGMGSIIVFGESGSGKTALRYSLTEQGSAAEQPPANLIVEWQPNLFDTVRGSPAVRTFIQQVFEACAEAFGATLGRYPNLYYAAPPSTQAFIHWFIQTYNRNNLQYYLDVLAITLETEAGGLLQKILDQHPDFALRSDTVEQRIIPMLAQNVRRIGFRGVWVTVDGFDPFLQMEQGALEEILRALLSTLELFEIERFALKIFAPSMLRQALSSSFGVIKGRIEPIDLTWTKEKLVEIVERRLAARFGVTEFRIGRLCEDEQTLLTWLARYGGTSPRGWLYLVRPLAEAYLEEHRQAPFTTGQWKALSLQHPPRLRLDLESSKVFLGEAEITGIQPRPYRLLRYLYLKRPHRVAHSELYYLGYQGLKEEPKVEGDFGWEVPAAWKNTLDNAISRLRKVIEPDPANFVYIIVDRGWGVKLENAG